jgi:hypothetical protein
MKDQMKAERCKEPYRGSRIRKTTVIVNRRTAVFVTIVLRVNPLTITPHPFLKDKGKRIKDETGKQSICMARI